MKRLTDAQLDHKIEAFMNRKLVQHFEPEQPDGVHAGKIWQMDAHAGKAWRKLEGTPRRPARLY